MKRKDLMRRIARYAKGESLAMEITAGTNHTKVRVSGRVTVVARHSEINEITAKEILRQIGAEE